MRITVHLSKKSRLIYAYIKNIYPIIIYPTQHMESSYITQHMVSIESSGKTDQTCSIAETFTKTKAKELCFRQFYTFFLYTTHPGLCSSIDHTTSLTTSYTKQFSCASTSAEYGEDTDSKANTFYDHINISVYLPPFVL